MSHIHQGPLATYNSLADSHLSSFFSSHRMRRHLRKAGLITKQGDIVSETSYRLNMTRKEHKKQVKDMLAQAIVHKTLDLERTRQAEIKKKLEEICKIQHVRQVRASTGRRGDEDILPYLTPRSQRPKSSSAYKAKGHAAQTKLRPNSAPGVRSESRHSQLSLEEDGDVLYLDDDGRPITSASQEQHGEQAHIDQRHLHTLDTAALRRYAIQMSQMEEEHGVTSPYLLSQVPLPPKARLSRPALSSRRVHSVSPQQTTTTDMRNARLHHAETAKAGAGEMQTMCRVLMKYHGWALSLARETIDPRQEVVVHQQHCGGNTLQVFKERLTPGSRFEFISYRHRGYPFSLTLYVDGQMDSRVSTCCEYRHARGAKIGGKQGHFSILSVQGAVPCYKCHMANGVLVRSKATTRKTKRPSERHMEEVIVVAAKKDVDHDDLHKEHGIKQAKSVEEEEDAVLIPVERDDDYQDRATKSSAERADSTYDDDFDDKSSASSHTSSSSESDSQAEFTSPQDEGAGRKKLSTEQFHPSDAGGEDFYPSENGGENSETGCHTPLPAEREDEDGESGGGDSNRTKQVKVNDANRETDGYSSGNDVDEQKAEVINMGDTETDNQHRTHQRARPAYSITAAPAGLKAAEEQVRDTIIHMEEKVRDTTTIHMEEKVRDTTIIHMEEKVRDTTTIHMEDSNEENHHKEWQKREEEQCKEDEEFLQEQRLKKERKESAKRASEIRRQEEAYEQQILEAQHQKKRASEDEAEKELSESPQQLEEKRRQSVIREPDTDCDRTERKHDDNFHSTKSECTKSEYTESTTDDSPRVVKKEEQRSVDDDGEDRNTCSSQSDLSMARSSVSLTSHSTPRQPSVQDGDSDEDTERSASLPPPDSDVTHPRQAEEERTPSRPPSPLPCPAVYLHRCETRDTLNLAVPPPGSESPPASPALGSVKSSRPVGIVSTECPAPREGPPKPTPPFPSAEVYTERPMAGVVDTGHSLAFYTTSSTADLQTGLYGANTTGTQHTAEAEQASEEEDPEQALSELHH